MLQGTEYSLDTGTNTTGLLSFMEEIFAYYNMSAPRYTGSYSSGTLQVLLTGELYGLQSIFVRTIEGELVEIPL
ncbi:MAG: hypothetical protein H6765_10075 [Candidatus Peribacteria bacterium]|nr:MAG: hypothetical protein H6765_10075 [Candidatus Peribacteria bacterium]